MMSDRTDEKLISLVRESLDSISLRQGVKEAKVKSPQSYAFHTLSVATLSLDICRAIYNSSDLGKSQLEKPSENYNLPFEELCFYGGFLHDWNKLEGNEEAAKDIIKKLGLPEEFLYGIPTMAEGHLPDNLHMPVWVSIKLADMLLISDIGSVKDVFYFANSDAYKNAVEALKNYNLELNYISSTFRLFTLIASKDLLDKIFSKEAGYFPLMSYSDGLVFLRRKNSQQILLSKVLDLLNKEIFSSSSQGIEDKVNDIKKCITNKEDLFRQMNIDVKSVIYDEKGKVRQLNAFLPSKVCKPFEDVVGNLDNKSKIEVAKRIIEELRGDVPFGVLVYFVNKFSKGDEDYIRRGLEIKEKSLSYLENITDVQEKIDKILELIEKKYPATQGVDKTLLYYIKHSFSGNVLDDLPSVVESPKDYCVVCGMPIYSDNPVRFVQYASELRGKAEIWIPREKGLEEIDRVRDDWKVCPICIYEANLMRDRITPPYFIVAFYPGIPISLLNIIDFDFSQGIRYYVDEGETYLNAFEKLGGKLMPYTKKALPAYFSSKVIIKASEVTNFNLSTRLSKSDINKLMPYTPMLSIIFLTSPVLISSDIHEIPIIHERIVSITSTYNYNFMKSLDSNLTTLYSIFAYSAKYDAMKKICRSDLDNCLGYLTEESDLYSSVDPALGVLSIGMGVGTPIENDEKFFSTFLPISGFLLKVAGMVSKMGESIKSSIFSIAYVLKDIIKSQKVSKYDVTGFLRDGIDMFFKTSSVVKDKEDRIGISVNASISSLENKYSLDDSHRAQAYSALQNIFDTLYRIEEEADRSLAISIANTLSNWLYIAYKLVSQGDKS
ncbi:CRISPR-associated protein [Saccharolobus islandicus]|uniref:CRISPR-associated protein n=1 Tax=Saccharolobus islandicus TaxID=43080 RepID=UPI003D7E5A87